jgi:structural maintenance of chromosome 4
MYVALKRLCQPLQAQGGSCAQGLHGRLGDLGAVDRRYDAAVSNAAGGLDHIVVDTVTQGQKCVAYLRAHNLGVATFLILEKQTHLAGEMKQQRANVPEGCERLFDLIKCSDEKIRLAFFWSVRNTLVCSDMAAARRIAYAGDRVKRVVTLQARTAHF